MCDETCDVNDDGVPECVTKLVMPMMECLIVLQTCDVKDGVSKCATKLVMSMMECLNV